MNAFGNKMTMFYKARILNSPACEIYDQDKLILLQSLINLANRIRFTRGLPKFFMRCIPAF
ncbi:uncharacterized protein RSE6_01747 [Rhynchosporium secalis]|uniref:Uncharacterized protein n=1 Tax=Rhynchosporium secalis TaxID=38038 RepID=A0A1E1LYL6_RHYSE|nr:uncharacterized protein RSE6_01747 [Rhynchosporium secalis]